MRNNNLEIRIAGSSCLPQLSTASDTLLAEECWSMTSFFQAVSTKILRKSTSEQRGALQL